MFANDLDIQRKYILLFSILLGLVMIIYVSTGSINDLALAKNQKSIDEEQSLMKHGLRTAMKTVTAGVNPSLEMKESVDFLLTPALIVQEALSDDVINTYPSE